MRVVLASASPARLKILRAAGLQPEVVVSGVDESTVTGAPEQVAQELAEMKAQAVASSIDGHSLVIGCDSVFSFEGKAFGKPADAAAAIAQWQRMRGRSGELFTGHCIISTSTGRTVKAVARTAVMFGRPSDDEITAYVETGEPLHVAGGFTIDGIGGWFVDRIEGDHTNVIGISLPLVRRLLGELEVPITTLW